MRYARHATKMEEKMFFDTLKANGLVYNAKTCTIKAGENYNGIETENVLVRRNPYGPLPFKVLKKRVRPTLCQIRLLEEKVKLLDEIINTHRKEKVELKEHLEDVRGCNEKMAKELKILKDSNKELADKNATLEQSNKLMEGELTLQRGLRSELQATVDELTKSDEWNKEYIKYLLGRSFFARLFNLK